MLETKFNKSTTKKKELLANSLMKQNLYTKIYTGNLNKDEISGQNRVHSKNARFVNLWKGS